MRGAAGAPVTGLCAGGARPARARRCRTSAADQSGSSKRPLASTRYGDVLPSSRWSIISAESAVSRPSRYADAPRALAPRTRPEDGSYRVDGGEAGHGIGPMTRIGQAVSWPLNPATNSYMPATCLIRSTVSSSDESCGMMTSFSRPTGEAYLYTSLILSVLMRAFSLVLWRFNVSSKLASM